ncbi:hypothetical protein FKP32DRAFT_1599040 [Trametes sanguinea]|nr:hypothetical protein FKP32DRAFT_1599040 [Trametes sanguinea]
MLEADIEPAPPPPDPATVSRAGRVRKVPKRFHDLLPTSYSGLPAHIRLEHPVEERPERSAGQAASTVPSSESQDVSDVAIPPVFRTKPDVFGLYRVYAVHPQSDPGGQPLQFEAACDPLVFSDAVVPTAHVAEAVPHGLETLSRPAYHPFPNVSTFDLVHWQHQESNLKSHGQMNALASVMQEPGFNAQDVALFDSSYEASRLDDYLETEEGSPFSADDRWLTHSVTIRLPKEGVKYAAEDDAPPFTIDDVYYRTIVEVVTAACQQEDVRSWTFIPYKLFWLADDPEANTGADSSGVPSELCSDRLSASPTSRMFPATVSPEPLAPTSDNSQPPESTSTFPCGPHDAPSPCESSSSGDTAEDEPGIRVYSEVWHADAWIEEDAAMRAAAREPNDSPTLEYALLPVELYSDSTHLTNFGSASLWPVYMYFLGQSKYVRSRPTAFCAHHIAYVPSLPDTLQDFYMKVYGIAATAAVLTFLKRELMQAIYLLLLDDSLMYIYVHGLLLLCGDGILRRLFLRFFIYAADYPEKMLLACLKYFAACPCPRCRINKDHIIEMGTTRDYYRRNLVRRDDDDVAYRIKMARAWVFERGLPLTSKFIARVLDPLSLTPTRSAFSTRLRPLGFNFYSLFVPDLMHEFELGVWKSIWVHLLRILYAAGDDKIQELNRRYRQIPSFGRSTIRRFSSNVSSQGKLAARDYEARLKCFIPAYDGLLVNRADNRIILDMVFNLSVWHALAKLREHTDPSLSGLDLTTVSCGQSVREFAKKTCANYVTLELPTKDGAARGRRKAAPTKPRNGNSTTTPPTKRKFFNYKTYKFHAMWDYATTIRWFASTDNWTTQVGELEHRHVKRFYARTNRHRAALQIAQHMRRAEKLRIIKLRVDAMRVGMRSQAAPQSAPAAPEREARTDHVAGCHGPATEEPSLGQVAEDVLTGTQLPYSRPEARYHIATSQRESDDLNVWASEHRGDPAFDCNFVALLKDHLLSRLGFQPAHDESSTAAPSSRDRTRILLRNNKIFWHRVLRVNYTTYDRQRTQDNINPRTHGDILLAAPSSTSLDHPFLYARVVRIFHVNARLAAEIPGHDMGSEAGSDFARFDVLWVHWFRLDKTYPGGFASKRPYRLELVPTQEWDSDEPFGFVNPADVIRGAHIIPAFASGHADDLRPSIARGLPEGSSDFRHYYVNMFADRDMFMRYYGGGIGHKGLRVPSRFALDSDTPGSEWQAADDPSEDDDSGSSEDDRHEPLSSCNIHSDADVLDLVPELTSEPLADGHGEADVEEYIEDGGIEPDSDEDDELEAHASMPDDGWGAQDGVEEDEHEENEYEVEGYAVL